jgi:hypothetical protein
MNGIRKNYYWGSIRFAMGTPANAGDFEKSIVSSGSVLSMMNIGLNATEEIFPNGFNYTG